MKQEKRIIEYFIKNPNTVYFIMQIGGGITLLSIISIIPLIVLHYFSYYYLLPIPFGIAIIWIAIKIDDKANKISQKRIRELEEEEEREYEKMKIEQGKRKKKQKERKKLQAIKDRINNRSEILDL